MRFPRLSLSLIALCATTGPAVADTIYGGGSTITLLCSATPTLSNCQDPSYLAMCPNWTSSCSQMVGDAFNQYTQSITTVRNALAPDNTYQSGSVVPTRYLPYDYIASGSKVRGATGGYFGSVMNHQAWVLNPTSNGTLRKLLSGFRYVDPEAPWQIDGTRVNSCEEYVYKRYLTASKFEDAIAPLGDDWMAILGKAFQTGFVLGTQEIDDETGAYRMNWSWPAHAKNIYYEIDIDHLPLSTYSWDPMIKSLLAAHPERTPAPDAFTLWSQVNDQVNQWGADLVELRYDDMKTFRKELAERDSVWTAFQAYWQKNQCDTADQPTRLACDWQHLITQGRLYNIDADLAYRLWQAYLDGCLYSSGLDECAIGPHQLVDEMLASVDAAREPDYDECRRITGDAFGSLSMVGLASTGQLGYPLTPEIPAGDYTATSAALKGVLGLIQQQFDSVDLPIDPSTHAPVVGMSSSDSASFGSGWFGAGYSYGAGWHMDFAGTTDVTNANVHIWGSLNAHGTLLNHDYTIVDFANNVDSAGSCGTAPTTTMFANTNFTLLGNEFYSYSDAEPAQFNLTFASKEQSGTLIDIPPISIPLGPVNVNVGAGVSGGVGYSATLQGSLNRDCTVKNIAATIGGGFTPFAHLDAYASASLGVHGVLEAGIRGTVTLARVDLPFTADLKTTTNGTLTTLGGWTNLDLKLSTFGGRIALFVDSLVYSAEMTLTSWPGKSIAPNLFHLDFGTGLPLNFAAARLVPTTSP